METLEQIRRHLLYMRQEFDKLIQYELDLVDEIVRLRKEIERLETALDEANEKDS